MQVYTLGHSTRSLDEFFKILTNYKIELVVDVRRFPKSGNFPHFNKEILEKELLKHGIVYVHLPELGGFRDGGYKAFTQTREFDHGLKRLLELVNKKVTVVMCSEKFFWRCHRKFIAEELVKRGYEVIHILNDKTYKHKLRT